MTAQNDPTWGVVCTAAEPTALMVCFAAHHLAMGARYVWMFLDRPNPEAEALLNAMPGCVVQVCHTRYWKRQHRGRRPRVVIRRQLMNAALVYSGTDLDWILHLDCDEFLRSDYPVAGLLAHVPAESAYGVFRPAERVGLAGQPPRDIFDGVFRRPDPHPGRAQQVGDAGEAAMVWRGMTGHSFGKSATRVGVPVLLGIHTPRALDRSQPYRPAEHVMTGAELLHFDGMTPLHWQQKLLRVAGTSQNLSFLKQHDTGRHAQVRYVLDSPDPEAAVRDLFARLKTLTPAQVEEKLRTDQLDTRRFDPTPALDRFGLTGQIDLSVDGFDAALVRHGGTDAAASQTDAA